MCTTVCPIHAVAFILENAVTPDFGETTRLLHALAKGDNDMLHRLILRTQDRLRRLTRRMLYDFPMVARWEETDDVLQNTLIGLAKTLQRAAPRSSRHLMNLTALMIRHNLLDLARKYGGPLGLGANHHTDGNGKAADDSGQPLAGHADHQSQPTKLEAWTQFHEWVAQSTSKTHEAFNLLWYLQLSMKHAAEVAGLSERTMKRRWLMARLELASSLKEMPN
jgi:DNA-directed RNA polymerase specialized sigma24 family protein